MRQEILKYATSKTRKEIECTSKRENETAIKLAYSLQRYCQLIGFLIIGHNRCLIVQFTEG